MTFKGNCSAHGGNGKPLKKVLSLRVMTFKGNCSAPGGGGGGGEDYKPET